MIFIVTMLKCGNDVKGSPGKPLLFLVDSAKILID